MRWRRSLAAALAVAVLAAPALAAPPDAENQGRLDRTVHHLQQTQNPDGGFGYAAGKPSDPGVSAWVAYALAAAGINPVDQAKPGGVDAYTYLIRNARSAADTTTDYERMALVAVAACTSPRDFGGLDLVAEILERRLESGAFTNTANGTAPGVNDTAFAVLPFSRLDNTTAQVTIAPAVEWLLGAQFDDGSWGWSTKRASQSVDMTGAVIQALNAGGRPGTEQQAKGFDYIRGLQHDDGGFPQFAGRGEPNVASTAWAVQAMWSAGLDPRTWAAGRDPLAFMAGLQQPDGSIRYTRSLSSNDLWMTAQVAPAFAGHPLPIACVPPAVKPPDPPPTATPTPSGPPADQDGQGGHGERPDDGVIAGGGGAGAPLFSRPQPQSRGRTAGGARELDPKKAPAHATATPTPAAPAAMRTLAAPGATPVPVELSPPTPTPAPRRVAGAGGGGLDIGADRPARAGGPTALPYVTGTLVSSSTGQDLAAAPGLRAAGAGGSGGPLASLVALALLGAALTGWTIEIRRQR